MQYHSTRSLSPAVDSAQAVLNGLAPDGGLYVPETIPAIDVNACLKESTFGMANRKRNGRRYYDPDRHFR